MFGIPPTRKVNLLNLDVMYGLSNRLSLDVTIPFSSGSGRVEMGTLQNHRSYYFQAGGLGDISLQAEYWLSDPVKPSNVAGSVGLGIRTPTGSGNVQGTVFSATEGVASARTSCRTSSS